ncbi:DUF726 domain-containing protein [Candidatus Fermentibacteria bacterium]|nr:DUF726 domain-containing protein [Candidatus Fermentibacteria bacterium]
MSEPFVRKLQGFRGSLQILVFFSGFHTRDYDQVRLGDWCRAFRRAGWRGSIYWFRWDSCSSHERLNMMWSALEWNRANNKAREAGERYAVPILHSLPRRKLTLVGHSLGAKVVYFALQSMDDGRELRIGDVALLAGAVHGGSDRDWVKAASRVRGRLVNVYNGQDECLGLKFALGEALRLSQGTPCGRNGIEEIHTRRASNIFNVDATTLIDSPSHTQSQMDNIDKTLGSLLWRQQRLRARALTGLAVLLLLAVLVVALRWAGVDVPLIDLWPVGP